MRDAYHFDREQFVSREPGEDDGDPRPSNAAPREPALRFRPAAEWVAEPAPESIVEGILWAGAVTILAGESGAGKSFVAEDLGAAVVDGATWHGRATERGSVALVAFEADALNLRFEALRLHGRRTLEDFYAVRAQDPLSPVVAHGGPEVSSLGELALSAALEQLQADLAAAGRPPLRLLIVDTVRASLSGSEDSSENVSAYLRSVRRILARLPGAGALLLHHVGWQDGEQKRKRERGSSALRGNVDGTMLLEVVHDEDPAAVELVFKCLKARDAERSAPVHLVRRRVDGLGTDRYGRPLTSCVIEADLRSRADREAEEAAEARARERELDARVLVTMRDVPGATSMEKLRQAAGAGKPAVEASVGRILRAGWATQGRRGQPYLVTKAGAAVLSEAGR